MSAKNSTTNNDRYFYVFLTEKRRIGDNSNHTPQHVTLVPPFFADKQAVLKVAETVASKFDPFEIKMDGRMMIGDKKDIPVILVKPNSYLQAVHVSLFDELGRHNINTGYTRFIRDEFTPHVTIKKYLPPINETQKLIFDHIAVMHKIKGTKTVVAKNMLGQSDETVARE